MKNVIIGVVGLALTVYLMIALHNDPIRPLERNEISLIAGRISRTRLGLPIKGNHDLYIWLSGNEIPFFINANRIHPSDVDDIQHGKFASIGIRKTDMGKPAVNLATKKPHYNLVTIEVDRQPTYTLERYNAAQMNDAKINKWFIPGMAVMAVVLIYSGIRRK